MDAEKLAKLRQSARIGGKGTPRRKIKRTVRSEGDDTKVQAALQKLNAQTITDVEQVNMFKDNGTAIHIGRPAVQYAAQHNTMAIHGRAVEKTLEELLPEMLNVMSPESREQLRKLSEQVEAAQRKKGEAPEAEDAEIPNLVEGQSFDTNVD